MPRLVIDGVQVEAAQGETILKAARRAGVEIPHFCWHHGLSIAANCRMCLVEVERQSKLQPACQAAAAEGMVVRTDTEKVRKARRAVMEFLLLNHPVDCPICDQAGECRLQDYYMAYDFKPSRLFHDKLRKLKVVDFGEMLVHDAERCVLCTRCVRFMDEVARQPALGLVRRGNRTHVSTFGGRPVPFGYGGNLADLCPVGALTLKDFRFKKRAWFLSGTETTCPGCATCCPVAIDHEEGLIYRLRPRETGERWWICDEGRLAYKHANEGRLVRANIRADGRTREAEPEEALKHVAARMKEIGPENVMLSVSFACTNEDAYAAGLFTREVLGGRRVAACGRPDGQGDDLLRKADKNPNRRGVTETLDCLGLEVVDGAVLSREVEAGRVRCVYLAGTAQDLPVQKIGASAVIFSHSVNENEATSLSEASLPACSFAEAEGTFTNFEGGKTRLARAFAPSVAKASAVHTALNHLGKLLGYELGCGSAKDAADGVSRLSKGR